MFLFVFYFQGVKGDDPITAGHRARADGDRDADRVAAGGHLGRPARLARCWPPAGWSLGAVALAGMTTLGVHTPYFWSALWLFVVGVGSGMFNSPNTAAMMGTVPTHRRGIAAGARTMLQNTGAVISIAFVLADRHLLGRQGHAVQDLLRRHDRARRTRRWSRSSRTCTRRCGCWPRRRWSAPRSACCGRRGTELRCGSASWRARRGRPRGPCATTRRSGCCRSRRRAAGAHREYGDERPGAAARAAAAQAPARALAGRAARRDARRGRARAAPRASGARPPTRSERQRILAEATAHVDPLLGLVRRADAGPSSRHSRRELLERRERARARRKRLV